MSDQESSPEDDALRDRIGEMLSSSLTTEVWPRAETSEMVNQIVNRLQVEAGKDLEKRLVIGGFTDHTITADDMEQPCETCMYYLVHRKYCVLPELDVPVEPEWSCRLWRI
ncbi:MAG: hypothetical protein AAGF94_10630 [Pseudomonadota bacterium]